jgi:ATP synthase protein I
MGGAFFIRVLLEGAPPELYVYNGDMKKTDRRFMMSMYTLATVGINIVVATFFGLGIGWFIDHKLFHGKTVPWFTLIFLILGIVAGFRNMVKIIMARIGDDEGENEESEDDSQSGNKS